MIHPGKTHLASLMAVLLLAAMIVLAWAVPRDATPQRPWLSHFLGDKVIVTFITAPPDMARSAEAVLMDAGMSGIVLKFGREEVFFSFANIMTVEPKQR